VPQPDHLVGGDDADLGALFVVEERGDADAEGVTDLDDGADAGVGAGLLDLDQHAAADSGAGRECVKGEAALGAPALDVARQGLGQQVEVRHVPSNSACSGRCPESTIGVQYPE
jgi:hypothetical protein